MRHNASFNLEGLDPDTREAAREAARRAGMSLEEWLNVTISDRAARVFADTSMGGAAPRRRHAAAPSYDELDAIAAKISKVTRGKASSSSSSPSSSRALDTVMSTVSAEADRRARENATKTAEALDSVARWIERAEDRMSENSRVLSEGARAAMERQERTASVLGEALGLMTKRLDEIERKVVDGQQPSVMAALKAVEKVEKHLAKLGEAKPSAREDVQIHDTLRGFEERIAAITDKLAETGNRTIGRRGLSIADEVKGAVAEIRSRQSMLDGESLQRTHHEVLKSLRSDIARLAGQLETVRPDPAQEERKLADLRSEIRNLQERMGGLASREEIVSLERTLGELTKEAVKAADAGREKELEALNAVIAKVESELAGLSELVAGGVQERLAKDYQSLSGKIEALAASSVDPHAVRLMMRELEAIRVVFSDLADPGRVQDLSDQVRELSRQVGQMARAQVDAIEFATLRSAVDEIRGAVKASRASQADAEQMIAQFGQLTQKLDALPERIPQADLSVLSSQYESVAQQIAQLSAEQPREQITRLSDQVERMAQRLEEMSGQLTQAQAKAMANEIEALSVDISRLPQPETGIDVAAINRQFEALSAKVDSLVARPVVADLGPVARQLEAIEKKLEAGWSRGEEASPAPEILERLDALTKKLETSWTGRSDTAAPEIIDRLDTLSNRLDSFQMGAGNAPVPDFKDEFKQLQRNLEAALANAQSATPVGYETLIARLDGLDQKLARPQERSDLEPLQDMLAQLAAKLDAAERPNAGSDAVDALEGQIAEIMKRLESGIGGNPALSSLERSMADLMSQIEIMRDGAVEAAERAAKAAIAEGILAHPQDAAREDLSFLTRSLMDLKSLQAEVDRRNTDKMGSVQETLDKLVERLTRLEEPARRGKTEKAEPDHALRMPRAEAQSRFFDRNPSKSLEEAALAQGAASGKSLLDEADRPIGGTGSLKGDVLLEPGSGRPAQTRAEAGLEDASDIKASFIAAARRAAQSAAAEAAAAAAAAESEGEGLKAHPRAPLSRDGSDPAGLAGRMRQMIANKRRPLLMGVAAILLAIGAFQMSARFLVERNNDVAARDGTQIEETAGLPAPSAPLEAAPGGAARSGPATTASIDINALLDREAAGATGPTASIIGAEDFLGEAQAEGETQAMPPRRDGETPIRIEETPSHLIFPSLVSADELPESVGPARLREAVLAGDVTAVYELASRAAEGRGMVRDQQLASRLFERAAAHGLAPAQYRIGNQYEKGLGVTRDFSLAALWYQRAAESGNARAMHNLAVLLAEGVSGAPDYEAAVGWFSRAAEYGIRDSQYNLAVLLARGLGAQQDLSGSYTWFAIAATQGDEDAAEKRDEVAARLGKTELELAKAKVEIWRPKAPRAEANEVAVPAHRWSDADKQASLSLLLRRTA